MRATLVELRQAGRELPVHEQAEIDRTRTDRGGRLIFFRPFDHFLIPLVADEVVIGEHLIGIPVIGLPDAEGGSQHQDGKQRPIQDVAQIQAFVQEMGVGVLGQE